MRKKYAVAVCQMDSQKDKQENLRIAGEMIAENASKCAKIIAFPETMTIWEAVCRVRRSQFPALPQNFCARRR